MLWLLVFTASAAVGQGQLLIALNYLAKPLMEQIYSSDQDYAGYLYQIYQDDINAAQEAFAVTTNAVGRVFIYDDIVLDEYGSCQNMRLVMSVCNTNADAISCEIVDYVGGPIENAFFIAETEGYCGANYPLIEVKIPINNGVTTYYPARADLVPPGVPSKIIGYIWKYPHLTATELNLVNKQVTTNNKILFRQLTSKTKNFSHTYAIRVNEVQAKLGDNFFYEAPLGLVVAYDQYDNDVSDLCPLLFPVNLYQKGNVSWIGNAEPDEGFDLKVYEDTFYCAPYMGYCGAYLRLQRLPSKVLSKDNFMTTDDLEATTVYSNVPIYQPGHSPTTVCWIWYPDRETLNAEFSEVNKTIRDANVRLARGYWTTGPNSGIKTYSVQALKYDKLVSQGKVYKAMDLGKVLLYNATILEKCPQLLKLKIFQEEGGNQRTFIGGNNTPPPATRGRWVVENTIYCAPYYNYCGATQYLWGLQSWEQYRSFLYTVDYQEVLQYSIDPNYSYTLCWIWPV